MVAFIVWVLIGILVGWIAGKIMKSSFAWYINLIIGIVGSWLGGALLGHFIPAIVDLGVVTLGGLITAVIGAVVLLWIISLFKK